MKTIDNSSRRYTIGFSVAGSLITILFFIFINFSTGCRFPWFIYPCFAVIWWPLAVIFGGRHSMKAFSLVGSLAVIALLVITNYITSWNYPWFLYASFAVIWWPLAVFFGSKSGKILSVAGSIAAIAFFIVTNYLTSPEYIWFYYPVFGIIWWPLSVFLARPRTIKVYSVVGALFILTFLTAENLIHSAFCPWVLLAVFPVLLWPAVIMLGKRASELPTAIVVSALGIAYYIALNILFFPGFPWAIFTAYLLLWWPISIAFAGRGHAMIFSLCGSVMSAAMFITLNVFTTPHNIWAVYPIFALIWWPLSIHYFHLAVSSSRQDT